MFARSRDAYAAPEPITVSDANPADGHSVRLADTGAIAGAAR
ncbi:MAG: hypothetical protein ACHQ4F_08590 [Candidatus Dormibacteria bacterium]